MKKLKRQIKAKTKRAPKKLKEAVKRQLMLEVFSDDDGNYTGTHPEPHQHSKIRNLWKYARTFLEVSAIVTVGASWGFIVTIPIFGPIAITISGAYIVFRVGSFLGNIIYRTSDSNKAESWLKSPDPDKGID